MPLAQLAILYAAIGLGCAMVVLARTPRRLGDAALLIGLWPLFGPFMFLVPKRRAVASTGLSELLPSADAVGQLRARLVSAQRRLDDFDAVLAQPELDLESLEARIDDLSQRGASVRALTSARSRRKSVHGLVRRRKVLAAELEELAELFLQLKTQTEVVRLAGAPTDDNSDSVSDLVADIQSRLEGIDELLQEDV